MEIARKLSLQNTSSLQWFHFFPRKLGDFNADIKRGCWGIWNEEGILERGGKEQILDVFIFILFITGL